MTGPKIFTVLIVFSLWIVWDSHQLGGWAWVPTKDGCEKVFQIASRSESIDKLEIWNSMSEREQAAFAQCFP
jgi:hypothetical protein